MKAPPAPTLKAVTVDPKTTALLMLDFMNQNLRQAAALRRHAAGDEEAAGRGARAKAPVVYSIIANTTAADVMTDVAPLADEP